MISLTDTAKKPAKVKKSKRGGKRKKSSITALGKAYVKAKTAYIEALDKERENI